ncbi:hypothetical protein TorRG33x02_178940, partial [Trema orientale]
PKLLHFEDLTVETLLFLSVLEFHLEDELKRGRDTFFKTDLKGAEITKLREAWSLVLGDFS